LSNCRRRSHPDCRATAKYAKEQAVAMARWADYLLAIVASRETNIDAEKLFRLPVTSPNLRRTAQDTLRIAKREGLRYYCREGLRQVQLR
jgi:hypothetical protein